MKGSIGLKPSGAHKPLRRPLLFERTSGLPVKGVQLPHSRPADPTPQPPLAPALTLVQGTRELGPDVAIRAGALRFHSQRHKQGRVRGFGTPRGRGGGGGNGGKAPQSSRKGPHVGTKGRADCGPVASAAPRREPSPQQGTPGEGHLDRRPRKRQAGAARGPCGGHDANQQRLVPGKTRAEPRRRPGKCPVKKKKCCHKVAQKGEEKISNENQER